MLPGVENSRATAYKDGPLGLWLTAVSPEKVYGSLLSELGRTKDPLGIILLNQHFRRGEA